MFSVKKRGLSPVIATSLLVAVALILALIILLWASNYLAEKAQKNDQDVDVVCGEINFEAAIYGSSLDVVNRGNIPLYGVQIRLKNDYSVEPINQFSSTTISNGGTASFDVSSLSSSSGTLIVNPIILAEKGEEQKPYVCGDEASEEIEL